MFHKGIYLNGRWCMPTGPVPGPGRDDDPARHTRGPGDSPQGQTGPWRPLPPGPDWMDDEQWAASAAARDDQDEPPDPDLELYLDPDHGFPPGTDGSLTPELIAECR